MGIQIYFEKSKKKKKKKKSKKKKTKRTSNCAEQCINSRDIETRDIITFN